MAYMNQEKKKLLAPAIKKICKKYGVKATLAVDHYSSLVLNIQSGDIDFFAEYGHEHKESKNNGGHIQVNTYWIEDWWTGVAKEFLLEVHAAMNGCKEVQNHDNNDYMTDYFDV